MDEVGEKHQPEISVFRREVHLLDFLHQAFGFHPVLDELGDGQDGDVEGLRESFELGHTGHGPVFVHDFADDAGGIHPGRPGDVHGGFGLTRPLQDAAVSSLEGKDVSRAGKVGGGCPGIDGDFDRVGAVLGGNAGGDTVLGVDGNRESGLETGGVLGDHQREVQLLDPFSGQGKTDQAPPVFSHEIDDVRRDFFGGYHEVPFVFPVLIVHEDDNPALFDRLDGHLYGSGSFFLGHRITCFLGEPWIPNYTRISRLCHTRY